jgi:23S rRNA pseudouridine2604 synthase
MQIKDKEEAIRINKYLSQAQYCSRRQADQLVREGRIRINGAVAVIGDRVMPGQTVEAEGVIVEPTKHYIYLAYHKPKGIICTTDIRVKYNIISEIGYPQRLFPIGRLDKESCGLLLLTNDGEISDRILRARNYHDKEYIVQIDHPIDDAFIRRMASGIPMLNTVTRPCKITKISEQSFRIVLTQGLNRQIRRMCEYFGYQVTHLQRVRVMNIVLGNLKSGRIRPLTPKELTEMRRILQKTTG